MARTVAKSLAPEGYDLDEAQIGVFVMDNTTSNDTMIDALPFTYLLSIVHIASLCRAHLQPYPRILRAIDMVPKHLYKCVQALRTLSPAIVD